MNPGESTRDGADGNAINRANAQIGSSRKCYCCEVVNATVAPNRPTIAVAGSGTQTNSCSSLGRNAMIRSQPAAKHNSQAASTTMPSTKSTSSSVHQTSHNNYEIQTQCVLQNRSGQQMAEKDHNSAKMLIILVSGEQRLITFTLPRESCTVQDLLEQVGVQFDSTTTIQCVENPGANIDFVVTVGFSVHESASKLISRAEQSLKVTNKQDSASNTASAAPASAGASEPPTPSCSSSISAGTSSTMTASSGAAAAYSSLVDATASRGDSESSKDSSNQGTSGSNGNKTNKAVPPRKVNPGFFVVCPSCGIKGFVHARGKPLPKFGGEYRSTTA